MAVRHNRAVLGTRAIAIAAIVNRWRIPIVRMKRSKVVTKLMSHHDEIPVVPVVVLKRIGEVTKCDLAEGGRKIVIEIDLGGQNE